MVRGISKKAYNNKNNKGKKVVREVIREKKKVRGEEEVKGKSSKKEK